MFFNLYFSFLLYHVICSADHASIFIRFLASLNVVPSPRILLFKFSHLFLQNKKPHLVKVIKLITADSILSRFWSYLQNWANDDQNIQVKLHVWCVPCRKRRYIWYIMHPILDKMYSSTNIFLFIDFQHTK